MEQDQHELKIKLLEGRIVELEKENAALKKKADFLDEQLIHTRNSYYRYNNITKKYDYVSNYIQEVSGYTPEEFYDKTEENAIKETHPDDIENVLEKVKRLHTSQERAVSETLIYRRKVKNKEYCWIRDEVTALKDDSGSVMAYLGSAFDITKEREVETRLKEEKQFVQQVLDSNPNIIYVKDRAGKFVLINKAMADLFEENKETLIKRLNSDYENFNYECEFLDKYENEVLRSGKSVTINEKFISPGGKKYWLHTIKSFFEIGNKKYLLVNSTDITLLRKSEIKLRNSETRYKSLIDSLDFPFIMLNNNLEIVLVNKTVFEWFDVEYDEIINKPYSEILGEDYLIPPDFEKTTIRAESLEFESQLQVNKENKWVWFNIQTVKDFEGNNIGFQLLIIDITERKKNEEDLKRNELTFRGIINATRDLIILLDKDLRVITANESAAIFSDIKIDEMIGKNAFELFGDEIGKKRSSLALEVLKTKEIQSAEEFVDGFYVNMTMYPILNENNNVTQIVVIVRDITPLKKAEIEIKNVLKKEIELSELKSSVLSTVSHEFRTPLAIILSNIQQLKKYWNKLTQEDLGKKSLLIENSIKHMDYMLNNVSVLDKSDRELLHYEPRKTHIETHIYELVQEAESLFDGPSRVEIQFLDKIGNITIDEILIRHIIINLLTNALKYSSEKRKVELSVYAKDKNLKIEIRDHGIGIRRKDLKNIWEPFFRGQNVSNIKGTGLGVTIVKRCVDLHKGSIQVNSRKNRGTMINVSLPFN